MLSKQEAVVYRKFCYSIKCLVVAFLVVCWFVYLWLSWRPVTLVLLNVLTRLCGRSCYVKPNCLLPWTRLSSFFFLLIYRSLRLHVSSFFWVLIDLSRLARSGIPHMVPQCTATPYILVYFYENFRCRRALEYHMGVPHNHPITVHKSY